MNTTKGSAAISLYDLTVIYQERPVLWKLTLDIEQGNLVGVIGPNGAGKTTLIKSLLDLVQRQSGIISFFGKTLHEYRSMIAYVPQRATIDWDFPINVFDVVLMGCYGKLGWFRRPSKEDKERTWQMICLVGLEHKAYSPICYLSGGQQQRVFVARALMQDPQIYLLDEPFSGIDMPTEELIISLLKDLRNRGKTIVVVHHDLHTLADYFDKLLLLNVKCIAYGATASVLKSEYMCSTYGNRNIFSVARRL